MPRTKMMGEEMGTRFGLSDQLQERWDRDGSGPSADELELMQWIIDHPKALGVLVAERRDQRSAAAEQKAR